MQPIRIGEAQILELGNSHEKHNESIQFKILLYKYEGYSQSYRGFSTMPKEQKDIRNVVNELKNEIEMHRIFKLLSDKEKEELRKSWRPSWNKISEEVELSIWNSKNMYNILSQYGHNSYTTLMSLDKYYTNLKEYDIDSMLVQLYEFTAILVNDFVKLFYISNDIFDKKEISLLNEFFTLAKMNPSDVGY